MTLNQTILLSIITRKPLVLRLPYPAGPGPDHPADDDVGDCGFQDGDGIVIRVVRDQHPVSVGLGDPLNGAPSLLIQPHGVD